jgi:hypothetical protein
MYDKSRQRDGHQPFSRAVAEPAFAQNTGAFGTRPTVAGEARSWSTSSLAASSLLRSTTTEVGNATPGDLGARGGEAP